MAVKVAPSARMALIRHARDDDNSDLDHATKRAGLRVVVVDHQPRCHTTAVQAACAGVGSAVVSGASGILAP